MDDNFVMMQAFEWTTPSDGNYYTFLKDNAKNIKESGIDALWLPPMCKGTSKDDVGYGIYDLRDLGEFDQKSTVRTKYGTKDELLECIKVLHENNIKVYGDVVLNHKAGADYTEKFKAIMVDQNDRTKDVSGELEIEGWTGFEFSGRNNKYSDFKWHYYHFSGIDFDNSSKTKAVYRILGNGKYWSNEVSNENGNYDYLMNADIDHSHPDVENEIFKWIDWYLDTTRIDGIRFDALKHIDYGFIDKLSRHIMQKKQGDFYLLGEYWQNDESSMSKYLDNTDWRIDLFDVVLHFNMSKASKSNGTYDMRKIFDNTLVKQKPLNAVTFVDNHDSQPGQSLESWVDDWFKEIAYALILFRKDGYPCIFAGDYYGINSEELKNQKKSMIDNMIKVRKKFAYGNQDDYFDNQQVIGWVRRGDINSSKLVVIISIGDSAQKQMFVGEEEADEIYVDLSGHNNHEIKIDENGNGLFEVGPGQVSYWVNKKFI
ncbi:MAG: alpha-amylase [Peptoniphilaceae bacterium]|nr:alpha-amylase [Peptoniphilaceae bacterium]MDD7382939.1 alpha-amylase [Peptoniphilaceae bacterium]MDY3737690.1 alpha-amylase [Peptoniphilaceae bacterium]